MLAFAGHGTHTYGAYCVYVIVFTIAATKFQNDPLNVVAR